MCLFLGQDTYTLASVSGKSLFVRSRRYFLRSLKHIFVIKPKQARESNFPRLELVNYMKDSKAT